MQENYEHYISKNIKSLYCRRLFGPIIYLIFSAVLWGVLPIASVVFPSKLAAVSDMGDMYGRKDVFVSATLDHLSFTGYTATRFNRTTGYYYYMDNPDKNECCIILLSPTTCEQGLPEIEQITVRGKILPADTGYETLLKNLSGDLSWTESGIKSKVNSFYLSEPDFRYRFGSFLFLLLAGSDAFVIITLLLFILFILKPEFSPPCQKLGHFGKPKELLDLAEEELATLPQLATEDMFITEHFFIETSKYGIAIVPINEIIWIYKHSTLHKLFWYHFSISYTLHITANKHVYIRCPKNTKSDIDGIIDYLSEANHDILVGFSEKNRQIIHGKKQKAQEEESKQ
ncbi:MAG: hypothetical protein HFI82_08660 [Eubacterium sp.]|jgi:hypothetical protein|nr:hypothetical protein [Eubacterium sp.]